MSQPNGNFTSCFATPGSYYNDPSSSQSFDEGSYTSSWGQPSSYSAPSPSLSVRTEKSAPNPRPSIDALRFSTAGPIQRNTRTDPSPPGLQYLPVPGKRSNPLSASKIADPITRFYTGDDSPWTPEHMRNGNVPRPSYSLSKTNYEMYIHPPGSETENLAARSDSGYVTHTAHSIISEPVQQHRRSEVTFHVGSVPNAPSGSFHLVPPADGESVYSGRSGHSGARSSTGHGKEIRCSICKEVSKCKSDHKKHMLRHEKPFKCLIPNCRRGGKGFTTTNDLARHKKSVHRIGAAENSYQCASENCRSKDKIWPRLDNFKQHISRMHKDEDEGDLIRRSSYQVQDSAPSEESMSMAPMESTLAGIGTGERFSNSSNELDDPVSGISLTPDQESQGSNQWITFDPSAHEFSVDVDQARFGNPTSIYNVQDDGHPPALIGHPTSAILARRTSFQRLDTLADVATSQTCPGKTAQNPQPRLSNAPQTKADQQREVIQQFSRVIAQNIQNVSNANPVELESVIMRALSASFGKKGNGFSSQLSIEPSRQGCAQSSSGEIGADMLAEEDKSATTKAVPDAPGPEPTHVRQRRRTNSSSSNVKNPKKCERCTVTVGRMCDLRKHMKRHTRPYGCTFPQCYKRFGAKSDWKRHENSQHFQTESYRCQLPSPSSKTPCGEVFYRAKPFEKHLAQEHKMTDEKQVHHEVKMRRIGKNGQGQFWCGFCKLIVPLERKRNAAWDERFDHIDNHFNKENRDIGDWHCIEARKTKREVKEEFDRDSFDDDDTEGLSPEDERPSPAVVQQEAPENEVLVPLAIVSSPITSGKGKRVADEDEPDIQPFQKRSKGEPADIIWYCCRCMSGPWAPHSFLACITCHHELCNDCNTAVVRGEET